MSEVDPEMSELTTIEKTMVARLLDMASNNFANHICNDLPKDFFDALTESELIELDKNICDWNGDPEEHVTDPDRIFIPDWYLASFLAAKSRGEV